MNSLRFIALQVVLFGLISSASALTYTQFTQTPFVCSGTLYFQQVTDFYQIVVNGATGSTVLLGNDAMNLNSLGYSINESLIYTVNTNDGVIYKMNSLLQTYAISACVYPATANVSFVSSLAVINSVRGDVDSNGIFWVFGTYSGVNTLFALDLLTNPTACLIVYQEDRTYFQPTGYDFSFVPLDGSFYSFPGSGSNLIQRVQIQLAVQAGFWNGYDIAPIPVGQLSTAPELYSITGPNSPSGSGIATFVTPQNIVLVADSGSNDIYGYNITQLGYGVTSVPGILITKIVNPLSSGDGASCPYLIYVTLDTSNASPTVGFSFNLTVVLANQYLSTLYPQLSIPLPPNIQYSGGSILYSNSSMAPSGFSYTGNSISFQNASIPRKASLTITIPVVGTVAGNVSIQGNSTNLPKNLGLNVLTNWPGTSVQFAATPVQVIAPSIGASNINGTINNATTITELITPTSSPYSTVSTTINLTNSGPGVLVIGNISTPAGFSFTNLPAPGTLIAVNSSQSFQVLYIPNSNSSNSTGNLVIGTNDPKGNFLIPLVGLTSGPQIAVTNQTGTSEISGVSAVDFGSTTAGIPVNKTFNIYNQGNSPLVINSVSLPTDVQASYIVNGTSYSSLPGGSLSIPSSSSIQMILSYDPKTLGFLNGSLTINSNSDLNSTFDLALLGNAFGPLIQVTNRSSSVMSNSTTLEFSNTTRSVPSYQSVTITNLGNATLDLLGVSVTGAGYSIISSSIPASLAPLQSTNISIQLENPSVGTYNGTLFVSSNDNNNPVIGIPLSGTVVDPVLSMALFSSGGPLFNGSTVNFGNTMVGGVDIQTVVLSNSGNQPLNISQLDIPSGFYYAGGSLSSSGGVIAPGASATLSLGINSTSAGFLNSTLLFTSNDKLQKSLVLNLQGVVGSGSLSVQATNSSGGSFNVPNSPSSIIIAGYAFVGGSSSQTITFTNNGSQYLYIYNSSLPAGISFGPSVPPAGLAIAPGSSANVSVTFSTSYPGVIGGLVTLNTSDPSNNPFQFQIFGYVYSWNFTVPTPNETTVFYMYMNSAIQWQHDIGPHTVDLAIMDPLGSSQKQILVSNHQGSLLFFAFTPKAIIPGKYSMRAILRNIQNPVLQQYNGKRILSNVFRLTP